MRLWEKVERSTDPEDCWLWTGALSKKRRSQMRPVISIGKRGEGTKLVARIVCEWFNGPPPTPLHEAGHTCPKGENCKCVNPQHLVWMTREENEQYKQRRSHDHRQDSRRDQNAAA